MFELEQITPLPNITITHIIKFVYSCSVRVPQARSPGYRNCPWVQCTRTKFSRSVTDLLCTPPFVAQLTLQTCYVLGISSASAHKQSQYWA